MTLAIVTFLPLLIVHLLGAKVLGLGGLRGRLAKSAVPLGA